MKKEKKKDVQKTFVFPECVAKLYYNDPKSKTYGEAHREKLETFLAKVRIKLKN